MCTFQKKTNDRVHIRLLQKALEQVLILKRVYKAIQFKQSSCLNIKFTTNLDNDFEKALLELMIISVFAKNIQNIKKTKRYMTCN